MVRWRLGVVILILIGAMAVPAYADHGGCYYDPHTMAGYGCTRVDYDMINLKQQMLVASNQADYARYWELSLAGRQLEQQYPKTYFGNPGDAREYLNVRLSLPLSHYQTIDSISVGDNVRYATVPNGGRYQLIFWDQPGRPMKVSALNHTTRVSHWGDIALSWLWGATGGQGLVTTPLVRLITLGSVVLPATGAAIALDGALTTVALSQLVAIPNSGDTEILVDILDTRDSNGNQTIYRNRAVVDATGAIRLTEMQNGTYWQNLGIVGYDQNGNPVW